MNGIYKENNFLRGMELNRIRYLTGVGFFIFLPCLRESNWEVMKNGANRNK